MLSKIVLFRSESHFANPDQSGLLDQAAARTKLIFSGLSDQSMKLFFGSEFDAHCEFKIIEIQSSQTV